MDSDVCPAVNNWSDYFKSVDSEGLKLNGDNIGVSNWNYFKKTGSAQLFLALGDIGVNPVSGDVLYIGGMFKAAKTVNGVSVLFKICFADSYFEFNGETWDKFDPNYDTVDFAKDLLKATLAICTGEGGDNGAALTSVWSTLAGSNHYEKLSSALKVELIDEPADELVVVPTTSAGVDAMGDSDALGAAMYRYDYCTAKYSLTNFVAGRTVTPSNFTIHALNATNNSDVVIIVLSILIVSFCGLGIAYFYLRKRKEDR